MPGLQSGVLILRFIIEKYLGQARVGRLETAHGVIKTPMFAAVATQAALKGVGPPGAAAAGVQALFANTFHLHLQPGEETIKQAGGLHRFMNWPGPILADSGGFQVFSLGAGYEKKLSKIISAEHENSDVFTHQMGSDADQNFRVSASNLVKIDEDGVTFRSPRDGRTLRLTPEKSIQIQHALGSDIILAFDECTSPNAPYEYQQEALGRTHDWAKRSLAEHQRFLRARVTLGPALFGIVQGGRFQDLREMSARVIGGMNFDGFGIGGSFTKTDIETAVGWVTRLLPEGKPRHLLGIGTVEDIFAGVIAGVDTFDCVTPTRLARHGVVETSGGRLNLLQARYRQDFSPIEPDCRCDTCEHYSRAYLAHLFRVREMLGPTLASVHNLYFFNQLMREIRAAVLTGRLADFRARFLKNYSSGRVEE